MFNFKLSGIIAGAAFIFSLVIGLVSGVRISIVSLRAFIFAVVFFGLTCLIYWLVSQFVPELLSEPDDILDIPAPGSRVNITVEDSQIVGAFPANNSESVDDIGGRPSTPHTKQAAEPDGTASLDGSGLDEMPQKAPLSPLDQKEKERYNDDEGVAGDFDFEGGSFKDLTGDSSEDSEENLETLENTGTETALDKDGISGAGPDDPSALGDDAANLDEPEQRRPQSSRGKPELAGDFNPKELAMGIRTVLKRDEKG